MNNTPGWASPGSSPSDEQGAGVPRPAQPADEQGAGSQWSKDQPPAGQWSPPSAPGPAGPGPAPAPGWGGGQHQGGWGRPPVAKPGVIPLRPLGVGEILDGAVSTLRAHWRTVLGLTITVSVLIQIGNILVQRFLVPPVPEVDPEATPAEALAQSVEAAQASLIGLFPTMALSLIGTLVTTALLTVVISRSVLGRQVNLSEAWAEARPRLPQLLGLTLLLPLMSAGIMAVGLLPGLLTGSAPLAALGGLAAFVVMIWLMIRFSLASPALMLERQGIVPAMRRSAKLVRGAWWRVFGILLLTILLLFLVSMIIAIPFSMIGLAVDGEGISGLLTGSQPEFGWAFLIITGIGAVISSAITYPISSGVTVLLYVDQRIRREALDLDLARAAGVAGYGSAPGDTTPRS
ncbi:glycerophosphoryl diester phosphodiesterase membrane domain-containing protein [Streptomyces sp. NPDC013953]|uniref:glycerophosphoryl diester phosphodiesterase membrane domain-containing protein n=1 Tax=Streptomyces sp. NPDC013953 TaxID=3364868 RepID=UPI0036FA428A